MRAFDIKGAAKSVLFLYLSVALSVGMMLAVSIVLVLPGYALGSADMDITFDIKEVPGADGQRDGSAVYGLNKELGIECSDASAAMGDGKWWIRCRYVAEEISYATDYLAANGLQIGHTYANIMIQPAGGNWITFTCALVLIGCLGTVWMWRDGSRLRREVVWIAANRWKSLLAIVMPGVLTITALALSHWVIGLVSASQVPPMRREHMLVMFITVVVTAPIIEELLYRGVIHDLLSRRSNELVAACIGTVLFVGAHVVSEFWKLEPVRVITLAVGSLALYTVRIRSGSLLLCIAGHMLLNLFIMSVYASTAVD